jgi:hypothetical protein
MTDDFDSFARKLSQEKQDREKLARDTAPEWIMLKGFTESLAVDGKGIESDKFEWVADEYEPRVVLDKVAAIFQTRMKNGMPIECRLRFGRKPLGPGQQWANEKEPLTPVVWILKPMVVGDDIHWSVPEASETPLSSAELADQIAILLAKFHLAYKKHYENWWPGKAG